MPKPFARKVSLQRHQLWKTPLGLAFVQLLYNAFGAILVPRQVPTWCQDDLTLFFREVERERKSRSDNLFRLSNLLFKLVAGAGFEPTTSGL